MVTTDSAGRWIQIFNPFRPQPADTNLARLTARHDTIDVRAAAIGFAAIGAVIAVLLPFTPIAPAVLVAIAAGVSAAFGYRARYHYELNQARRAVRALDQALGPAAVSKSLLATAEAIKISDASVDCAHRILTSNACAFGALGPTADVQSDVILQLWDIVQLTAEFDGHATDLASAETSQAQLQLADRPSEGLLDAARTPHQDRRATLRALVHKFASVADTCDSIDSRLLAPGVEKRLLKAAISPIPHAAEVGAADRLIARVEAANEVLDAGGAKP